MGFLEACRPYMGRRCSPESIMDGCKMGDIALWGIFNEDDFELQGVCTTQPTYYPEATVLTVVNASGEKAYRYAGEVLDILKNYAKDTGCSGIELFGPEHVVRWASRYGFTKGNAIAEIWLDGQLT